MEVGENNIGDSDDEDYVPNNDEECSVSSGDPNSSDDELVITRKNLKEFNDLVVDNAIGLGFDKCTRGFNGSSGAGTSRSNDIESDNSGYHSEYLDSEGAETPVSSDEDDWDFKKKRKSKKEIVYDANCDHKNFEFVIGMKFTNVEQFRGVVQNYAIANDYDLWWKRTCTKRMEAQCQENCSYKLYGSKDTVTTQSGES